MPLARRAMVRPMSARRPSRAASILARWTTHPLLIAFAAGGVVLGVVLFGRGLLAYRRDRFVSAVATSGLDSIAAGEVRVSGIVEVIDRTLLSPLQARPCVWYRVRVESSDGERELLEDEERGVHFRLRDGGGSIRVVPDGARWEFEPSFDASTSRLGEEPVGLQRRPATASLAAIPDDPEDMTEEQRQAAIEALLTVQLPEAEAEPGASSSVVRSVVG